MPNNSATLGQFLRLIETDPKSDLVFTCDGHTVRPGYHVTELKHSEIHSIDCGRKTSTWNETSVQLLDGPAAGDHSYMSASKFAGIARSSLAGIPGLEHGELFFEVSPPNMALGKWAVGAIDRTNNRTVVTLGPVRAVCKPVHRAFAAEGQERQTDRSDTCCGPRSDSRVCCAG